jgi:hypothetical protein
LTSIDDASEGDEGSTLDESAAVCCGDAVDIGEGCGGGDEDDDVTITN